VLQGMQVSGSKVRGEAHVCHAVASFSGAESRVPAFPLGPGCLCSEQRESWLSERSGGCARRVGSMCGSGRSSSAPKKPFPAPSERLPPASRWLRFTWAPARAAVQYLQMNFHVLQVTAAPFLSLCGM